MRSHLAPVALQMVTAGDLLLLLRNRTYRPAEIIAAMILAASMVCFAPWH
jgi:hypothetical protein